jgi:hypothetical protein
MDITIPDHRLRAALASERESNRRWGSDCANLLRQRLCELAAAEDLGEAQRLPTLRLFREASDSRPRYTVHVPPRHYLVFEPAGQKSGSTDNPGENLGSITAIRIIAFEIRGT